jgi:transposase InsO family protein
LYHRLLGLHRGDARPGVPFQVLADNGKQFTGRHTRTQPVEVLFERICRENGITRRLTKPRSPTTRNTPAPARHPPKRDASAGK